MSALPDAAADDQQMAQIREILFGEQQRRLASRLDDIERRLAQQNAAQRELLDQRLRQLGEQLHADLDKQGLRQQAAIDGLDNALRALVRGVDDKLMLVDSDLQDLDQRHQQAVADQLARDAETRQRSVSREQLAVLLEQLAQQLRDHPA
jgi:hypothetical protein